MPQREPSDRHVRRTLVGTVTSDRMKNTITVLVERTFRHPKYGKFVRENKRYHAHDEREEAGVGDRVEIMATRPISRLKRWRLVRVVEAAPERGFEVAGAGAEARGAGAAGPRSAAGEPAGLEARP
jgi:small subunit ribosomal protein S17